MVNKIRSRVEALFEEAPKTRKAYELQDELIANLTEKYNDFIEIGKSQEEAYNSVIASIGDVDELIRGLNQNDVLNNEKMEEERRKTALVVSGAVGGYILSLISIILLTEVFRVDGVISVSIFLLIAGGSTCTLIYHFMSKPKYRRADETIVEEFKEWKRGNSRKHQIYKSVVSIMWPLITATYFFVSFVFGTWAYSWIIFILGAVLQQIIRLIFDLTDMRE